MTGLPVAALVVPASFHENRASELMLETLTRQGVTGRLELVLVAQGRLGRSGRLAKSFENATAETPQLSGRAFSAPAWPSSDSPFASQDGALPDSPSAASAAHT